MDADRLDDLARSLARSGQRRTLLRLLTGGALGLAGWPHAADVAAKNCKKIKNKKKRKKCLKKAKTAPSCTRNCAGKTCGDDGCGGSCGRCTGPEVCQSGSCVCVPQCDGKLCGDDGCGSECGTCTGGNCDEGACTCSGGQEFCGGACRDFCETNHARRPASCECCSVSAACQFFNECCSLNCKKNNPTDTFGVCEGLPEGAGCSFDGECASGNCRDSGIGAGTCGP